MVDNTGPACITCVYSGTDYRLECRIKPPSPDYKNYGRMFPFVKPDDWCSKYKAKPQPEPNESFRQIVDTWVESNDDG